jgi:hypothetical protein
MRFLFFLCPLFLPLALAGELTFAEKTKVVSVAADATSTKIAFEFTNKSNEEVVIKRYESTCSCLSVGPENAKVKYAPGESGKMLAEFDVGESTGEVEKQIAVWLEKDGENAPSIQLTVRLKIPEVILIEPKTVNWTIGDSATPKSIVFTIDWPEPIHLTSVSTPSTDFKHELKTLEDGKKYELVITPLQTAKSKMAVYRINTDAKLQKKHGVKTAYALVKRSVAKEGSPAKP